jgi:hypothetical protein
MILPQLGINSSMHRPSDTVYPPFIAFSTVQPFFNAPFDISVHSHGYCSFVRYASHAGEA